MKTLIKQNIFIVITYLAIVLFSAVFLLNYGKVQIHLYMNQVVGNTLIDKFFYYITYLGDGRMVPVIILILMFYNLRLAVCTLITFVSAALITNGIKYYLFDEVMRPSFVFQWFVHEPLRYVDVTDLHIHNSFPSGHATQAFAVFITLALFFKKNINKLLFLSIALLAAYSRVYLSQHWLVDVTIGSLIGASVAFVLFYLIDQKNKWPGLNAPLLKLIRS